MAKKEPYSAQYKGVHKEYGSLRNMVSPSSIKKDEVLAAGDGRFALDDIPLDHQIWEAIEFQDELHRQACIEHENKVVIDGLEQMNQAYDKNHEVTYQVDRMKRMIKQGRFDREKHNRRQRRYYLKHKEERKAYFRKYYQLKKAELKNGKRKGIVAVAKGKPRGDSSTED
jgi:hypothetical protein|tara:strand:+ start:737 stop:1246 length:510 start_codon:yes stop_codon:yes gene_type:complete